MSISNANDDSLKNTNVYPTLEEIYSNINDNEIILDRGCFYGRCVGLYVTLNVETGYVRCPFCGNGRTYTKEEVADILESGKYKKELTERIKRNQH